MTSDETVARQIIILGRKIRQCRNQYIRHLNLTSEQADALRFFADHPQETIAGFRTYQEITHQTARQIVQGLVQKGLVVLTPNPTDGRAKLVTLTVNGHAKRTSLDQHIWQTSQKLLTDFTPREQRQLLTLLQRTSSNLERN